MPFVSTIMGVCILRGIFGAALSFDPVASFTLLIDYFPAEHRTLANSVFTAALPIGAVLCNFSVPLIGTGMGWRGVYALSGACGIVVAICTAIFLVKPKRARFS